MQNLRQISSKPRSPGETGASTFESALRHITKALQDGLKHGFFEVEIKGVIGNGNRREVTVVFGLSHKFVIPLDELEH